MAKKPSVSLVILNFNAKQMTLSQLENISKLDTSKVEATCIVVDNNSSDGSQKVLSRYSLSNMDYKFIQSNKNLGFAGGNNLGIREALINEADYIIIMNNDLVLEVELVNLLVEFMENNQTVGVASPKIYFAKGFEFHKNRYNKSDQGKVLWYAGGILDRKNVYVSHRGVDEVDGGQYDITSETDVANGACAIIRSSILKKVGLFNEKLFLYWEDVEFSERVRMAGFNVVYFPNTHLWHKVSSSTGGSGGSANDYFLTRNRFYFSMKYSPLKTKLAVLKDMLRLIFVGRKWQKIGALDALCGVGGIGLWKFHA